MVDHKLLCLLAASLVLALSGCEYQSQRNSMAEQDSDQPAENGMPVDSTWTAMGEAYTVVSDEKLRELRAKAEKGDYASLDFLVNSYYRVNYGENHPETFYWELKGARFGYCGFWTNLMFVEVDDSYPIPQELFEPGETLLNIGEANGCGPYIPVKDGKKTQ